MEFINVDKLSPEELENYEQGVTFIKGVESPFKYKPGKVVTIVAKEIPEFKMHIHTNCWKHYNARPQNKDINYKGQYAAYIEGFDGYLYSLHWANFLIDKLKREEEFDLVK